jgi:hypothetical protein
MIQSKGQRFSAAGRKLKIIWSLLIRKNFNMKKVIASIGAFMLPVIALAQGTGQGGQQKTLGNILETIRTLVNQAVFVLVAIGILVFVYGIVMYVISKDEAAKENARNLIIYGVIGLFAIVAVWGLVNVLANTFGVGGGVGVGDTGGIPCIPAPGQSSC